jgi:hypothetical protein
MRFNPNLKRRLLGFASVIIGIVMILSQLMSLFFIDYFAGDCTPRAIRFWTYHFLCSFNYRWSLTNIKPIDC